uniref:Carboxypeptidase n=1 Tax=Globisporangium ultimum (strain ATCC 200006 / CBS 805.95 / DAOM BR144) TaxID=431595 RepID=K3WIJ5_GLOUD
MQSAHAQRILASERPSAPHAVATFDDAVATPQRKLLSETQQDRLDDLVKDLPGLDPTAAASITQRAGRIGLSSSTHNNIFYWHFAASKSPETAPLVIWLNGGPGCSSMQGLFLGISPFKLVNGTHIEINKHSWHHSANMLFIDQPVGTGMSQTRGNSYRRDEDGVAHDFYEFLVKFLQSHSEYLSVNPDDNKQISREIYIFGESHAGRWIPEFSEYILKQNNQALKEVDLTIRLRGVGIGNGWVHPLIQYDYSDFAHGLGLLTFGQVRSLKANFVDCQNALVAGNFNAPACFNNMNSILAGLKTSSGKRLNYYDVREYRKSIGTYPSGQDNIVAYLNQPSVRKALHANEDEAFKFEICSDPVFNGLQNFDGVSTLDKVQHMLQRGMKVMFYNGQWDMMCNHYGTEKLLLNLDWNGSATYQEAKKYTWMAAHRGDPAGFAQQGGNLTYLVIANGGHMVPYDVPDVAADMMRRFVTGDEFTDSAQTIENTKTNMTDLESLQCYVSDTTTSSTAKVLQLGTTWLWVAVLISVMTSLLAVSVTLMYMRNKKAKQPAGHSIIVQESDDEDAPGSAIDESDEESPKAAPEAASPV